jgi:hypothetical protein
MSDGGKYLATFGAILVIGWVLLNNGDPSPDAVEFTKKQRASIGMKLSKEFPGADIRTNMVGDRNLEVWMPRGTLDNLAFKDREQFVTSTGMMWCQDDWQSNLLFSTLDMRDLKSGKKLATYHCTFSYVRVESE